MRNWEAMGMREESQDSGGVRVSIVGGLVEAQVKQGWLNLKEESSPVGISEFRMTENRVEE